MKKVFNRLDSFVNVLSGVMTKMDPRTATKYKPSKQLSEQEIRDIYNTNGIAKRIVDILPDMANMKPWTLEGDAENAVWNYLHRIGAPKMIRRALRWARAYGGSVILIGVDDGRAFDAPVNYHAIRSLSYLRVYDRYCVNGSTTDLDDDPTSPRFGLRKYYRISPRGSRTAQAEIRVHYTRIIEIDGVEVDEQTRAHNDGWGNSIFQTIMEDLRRYFEGLDSSELILRDFVQGVVTMKGLFDLIGSPDGEEALQKRISLMDLSRSTLNTMFLDEGETYTKVMSSVAGVNDVLSKFQECICASAQMPQTIVFGTSPKGMNATGESDTRNFYDLAASYQGEHDSPIIITLAELALLAADFADKKPKLEKIEPKYAPLWQETKKEIADTRKVIADTDKVYMDAGVLDPSEVANTRFAGDEYNGEKIELAAKREMMVPVPGDPELDNGDGAADPTEDEPPAPPKPAPAKEDRQDDADLRLKLSVADFFATRTRRQQ